MLNQREQANLLTSLHRQGDPLILYNIWDAGSAKAVQESGAKVIATGSWSVAAAHGYPDREQLPFEQVLLNLNQIIPSVELPVTLDLEGCYAQSPQQVEANVAKVLEAGAVGINFEDQIIGGEGLYSIEDQSARLRAARTAAEQAAIPLFINARTDIFLKSKPDQHTEELLEAALERATAYTEAGASGFFAPGLREPRLIEKLCKLSPLPVNIMILPDTPSPRQLANLGVSRISYGAGPYRQMIAALKEAAGQAFSL